ncbi:hypothetical protein [Nocardiopsis deserti]|uniref:hypothetical protein n=1 Tax=Nocardiopsis deserti TaxID=2605988 RepID=UPI001239833B|nr:hypothetical protein [Nocardiopsis deserti]
MTEISQGDVLSELMAQAKAVLIFASSDPQAEIPDPSMDDMDSFSIVQIILMLEEVYNASLLEELSEFTGKTFEEMAGFLAERIRSQQTV